MSKNPLCEVFGFPISNLSNKAVHYRKNKLCPYNNISANCTKDKAQDPLGVCSIYDSNGVAITCPVRFRQDWIIATDAASFFFEENTSWTSLSEIRLNDSNKKSAGNIDHILVSYDHNGKILDFGAVEVQGVYISGNIRKPFEYYMQDMSKDFVWETGYNYPKADYLSSSRKRLVPQLLFKGGILHSWRKKIAVVLLETFFDSLPILPETKGDKADIAWLVYGLDYNEKEQLYQLVQRNIVYTQFSEALQSISTPKPGNVDDFIGCLQEKLDQKFECKEPPEVIVNPKDFFQR
jgi:hypothetical protein